MGTVRVVSNLLLIVHALTCLSLQAASWMVPGVVNAADSGSHWATECRLQNRTAAPALVELTFWPEGSPTASETVAVTIEPGRTLPYANLLRDVWKLEDARGAVSIKSDAALLVTAFRYTDEANAVLGQALPALASDQWLTPGLTGDLLWLAETGEWDSGIWVVLDSPEARAEVALFDGSGAELARTTLEDGAGSRWLTLASLGLAEQPLVRARVRFLAGSGVAASETRHVATGDRMGAAAQVINLLQTDLSVNPALRGSSFRTGARVYNPSAREASFRFTWNGKFVNRTLAPGQMVEVDDVAAAVGLEGEQQGLIRISTLTTGVKLGGIARVVRVREDGSTGPGELVTPDVTVEFGGSPNPWLLAGVPAAADSLFLGIRGGFGASESEVKILDGSGAPTFASAEPLGTPALGARLDDLLAMAGGSLPANGTVEVSAKSGQMAPSLLGLLKGSGDVAPLSPARVVGASPCVTPLISSFTANPATLNESGEALLSWRTTQAATVRISIDGATREANGSASFPIAESATVTLTASNSCGQVSKDLNVVVGPPQITAAQVPGVAEAAAGRPGQLAQFTIGNLSAPSRITALVFRAANGPSSEAPVEGVDALGRVHVLVPYLWIEGAERYYRGAVTVSVELDDGSVAGELPFQILPLQGVDGALTQFGAMLASLKEMAAAVESEARKQGLSALAEAQKAAAAPHSAALDKLASDLAAFGTGTLAYSTTAGAISMAVTRQDIEELMAYELNVREAMQLLRARPPEATVSKAAGERGADNTREAGTCLAAKEPFIPFCKAINIRQQLEAAASQRASDFIHQFTDGIPPDLEKQGEKAVRDWIAKKLAKTTLYGILNRIKSYTTYLNLVCLVRPIELDRFYLTTVPPRRSSSALKEVMYSQYDNQPTLIQVNALLKPHYDSNRIRDKLIEKEAKYVAKQLAKLKVPSAVSEAIMRALLQSGQDDVELKAIEAAAKALNFKPEQSYQVGKCDLVSFFPSTGLKETGRSAVRVAPGFVQGEDNFYYIGRKINSKALMCIEPVADHYLFTDRVMARGRSVNESGCPFSDQVITRGARAADDGAAYFPLPEFSDDVNVGPGEGVLRAGAWTGASNNFTSARPAGYNAIPTEVPESSPWMQEYSSGPARARAVVRKAGRNKWEIEASADGEFIMITDTDVINYTANVVLDTTLAIPETRSGTYTLKLESSAEAVAGVCGLSLSAYSAPKTEGGNNSINGIVSANSPRSLKYSVEAKDQPGPAGIGIGLFAYTSNQSQKPACRAKGTIELILPEE